MVSLISPCSLAMSHPRTSSISPLKLLVLSAPIVKLLVVLPADWLGELLFGSSTPLIYKSISVPSQTAAMWYQPESKAVALVTVVLPEPLYREKRILSEPLTASEYPLSVLFPLLMIPPA